MGILVDADLPLLEQGFVLLADARYFHQLIDSEKVVLDRTKKELTKSLDTEELVAVAKAQAAAIGALVSLNGMHVKALTLFNSIICRFAITPSERAKILHALKPKTPGKEAPRKSIKKIIGK